MGKRGRGAKTASPMKKAKVDPAMQKIQEVTDALADKAVAVPDPATNRQMLLALAPKVLALPSSDRHAYEQQLAAMIGDVLSNDTKTWEGHLASGQRDLSVANGEKTTSDAVLTELRSRLDTKKEEVTTKQQAAQEVLNERVAAQEVVDKATSEVDNFETNQATKVEERENYSNALTDDFGVLNRAEFANWQEKKKVSKVSVPRLQGLLQEVGADKSLVDCMEAAFQRKPDERGRFDGKAIDYVESLLTKHIAELDARISGGPALKAEFERTLASAQAAFTAIETREKAADAAAEAADEERKEIQANVKAAVATAKASQKAVDKQEKALSKDQEKLDFSAGRLAAFNWLKDPPAPEPEPVEEVAESDHVEES